MALLTELEFMASSNYRNVAPDSAFNERQGLGVFLGPMNHILWLGSPAEPCPSIYFRQSIAAGRGIPFWRL